MAKIRKDRGSCGPAHFRGKPISIRSIVRGVAAVADLPLLWVCLVRLDRIVHTPTEFYVWLIVIISIAVGALIDRGWPLIAPLAVGLLLLASALTFADQHTAVYPGSDTTQATLFSMWSFAALATTVCLAVGVGLRRFARRSASAS